MLKRATRFILDRTVVRSVKYVKSRTDDYNENLLDVYKVLWDRAAVSSADYIERHLTSILLFHDREPLWDHAITRAKTDRPVHGIWCLVREIDQYICGSAPSNENLWL